MYTNKTKHIEGHWYKPLEYLKSLKNTVMGDYWTTSSSAGNWEGYFVQKIKNKYYLIFFTQENNWPRSGYTLNTGNYSARFDTLPTQEELESIVADIYNVFNSI